MKNMSVALILICILCVAVISCRSMIDRVTPCEVPEQAYEYVHGTLDGYKEVDSLYNVRKLRLQMIIQHRTDLIGLKRAIEDEGYEYNDAIGLVNNQIEESQAFQDLVVGGPDTEFSLIGILAGFTGGAAIGKMLKRKGDYSPAEVEEVVARAKTRKDES